MHSSLFDGKILRIFPESKRSEPLRYDRTSNDYLRSRDRWQPLTATRFICQGFEIIKMKKKIVQFKFKEM